MLYFRFMWGVGCGAATRGLGRSLSSFSLSVLCDRILESPPLITTRRQQRTTRKSRNKALK